MNFIPVVATVLLLLVGVAPRPAATAAEVASYFSPAGQAARMLTTQISTATTSVDLAAFQLTHPAIIDALAAAHSRGLAVRVLLDPRNEQPGTARFLRIPLRSLNVRTDAAEKLFHNKYAIIDGHAVATGSFNFTIDADQRNAENLIVITDDQTARRFADNFNFHWSHARPYTPAASSPPSPPRPRNRSH